MKEQAALLFSDWALNSVLSEDSEKRWKREINQKQSHCICMHFLINISQLQLFVPQISIYFAYGTPYKLLIKWSRISANNILKAAVVY